jgi:AcrR family transcriptional regulator
VNASQNADDLAATAPRGRAAAGQDPAKRDQILDGAKNCFLKLGFEAASMNEITSEAGVSKGTIYVYFQNKEELFTSLIDRERSAMLTVAAHELNDAQSIEEALQRFGVSITTKLTSDMVIRAQRMVLAVAERMPDLAARFFGPDPFSGIVVLKTFLDAKVASGELRIEDTELASRQFFELAMAASFKRRLFGNMRQEMPAAEISRTVASGVAMFLKFYRA